MDSPPSDLSEIYHDGRHYDRLFGSGGVDFWLALAARHGGPVLELGCGTGRISIPLAEAGHRVTGMDLSGAMLREARRKADERGMAVDWVRGDMRDFDLGTRFGTIILAANALCHLLTLDDFERCMASVRRHMGPDSRFAIDVFVPDLGLLNAPPDREDAMSEYDDPDGAGRIRVTTRSVYEPDTQIRRNTTLRWFPGREAPEEGRLDMRMYFPQELIALLRYNGFRVERAYGGLDGRPFDAASTKQVLVATLAPDAPA